MGEAEDDVMRQCSYRVDFDPPPRGVFVTELGHLHDEEKEGEGRVIQYPVVKESGRDLLKQGVRTQQKTLLLKEQLVVDRINDELAEQKRIFQKRMDAINLRREKLQKRQEDLRKKMENDQKYVHEQDAKRFRAVEKYKNERRNKERMTIQQSELSKELDALKKRNRELRDQINQHKPYDDYMNKVIDILPDNYVDSTDSKVFALMMRHSTLFDTHSALVERMNNLSEKVNEEQRAAKQRAEKHSEEQLDRMMEIARLRSKLDKRYDSNQELEQKIFFAKNRSRKQLQDWGQTELSLRNFAERCRFNFRTGKAIALPIENPKDYDTMIYRIDNYIQDHKDIVVMARDPNEDHTTVTF